MNVENGIHDAHYYVPPPSRWPLVGACALFLLGLGAGLGLNQVAGSGWLLLLGGAILGWMLFGWFGDVVRESESGHYGAQVDYSFRWGMSWFIFSEVMFFAAFFGALFYTRTISVPELGQMGDTQKLLWPAFQAHWPLATGPQASAYQAMPALGLPALNTALLLTSGATLTWAHWGLLQQNRPALLRGLLLTIVLGLLFLSLQAYEYHHAWGALNLTLASGAYGATFYLLTGFHGLHVLVGTILLITMYARARRGHFNPVHHFAFEASAWYWHFVDVVWLMLFIFVYVF
jgi:cytochrome c oxidase subunit 3